MELQDITTVKLQDSGYLLNGIMSVPNALGNGHYRLIQDWIALGNTPDPEFSIAELFAKAQATIRATRDACLVAEVDPYQKALVFASLTTTQQTEITQYRLDLLNVPQQAGFEIDPPGVTMPTKPAWV